MHTRPPHQVLYMSDAYLASLLQEMEDHRAHMNQIIERKEKNITSIFESEKNTIETRLIEIQRELNQQNVKNQDLSSNIRSIFDEFDKRMNTLQANLKTNGQTLDILLEKKDEIERTQQQVDFLIQQMNELDEGMSEYTSLLSTLQQIEQHNDEMQKRIERLEQRIQQQGSELQGNTFGQ